MEWSFARDAEILRCEVGRDDDDRCFRLIVIYPDGTQTVEEIAESTALAERITELLNTLRAQGWEDL